MTITSREKPKYKGIAKPSGACQQYVLVLKIWKQNLWNVEWEYESSPIIITEYGVTIHLDTLFNYLLVSVPKRKRARKRTKMFN